MILSASPSTAMPRSALFVVTALFNESREVAPQSLSIFMPFGVLAMLITFAPSSSNTLGATLYAAPLALSTTIVRPSKLSSLEKVPLQNSI